MNSTDAGMQIDESDEHFSNAKPRMHKSAESDSNVTWERSGQREKQSLARTMTERGITIDESDGQSANA
jgi:hypothetical protein